MDRRYTCYLSIDGAKRVTEERDYILKVKLPEMREAGSSIEERRLWLKHILHLNRWLNYDGNPQNRKKRGTYI